MKKQLLIGLLLAGYLSANQVYDMTQEEYDAFQKNPEILMQIVQKKQKESLLNQERINSNTQEKEEIRLQREQAIKEAQELAIRNKEKEEQLKKQRELFLQKQQLENERIENEQREKELARLKAELELEKEKMAIKNKLLEDEKARLEAKNITQDRVNSKNVNQVEKTNSIEPKKQKLTQKEALEILKKKMLLSKQL